jgi:hypothetical protein
LAPALALLSRPSSRRARPATDEVFEASSSPTRAERESSASRELHVTRNALGAAWDQLASEIDRVNRPRGRATAAVREGVRRIVRLMLADGASRDEIRSALTRAVMGQHRSLDDVAPPPEVAVSEALLADVLHCAASVRR